jgi:hypothetical protein
MAPLFQTLVQVASRFGKAQSLRVDVYYADPADAKKNGKAFNGMNVLFECEHVGFVECDLDSLFSADENQHPLTLGDNERWNSSVRTENVGGFDRLVEQTELCTLDIVVKDKSLRQGSPFVVVRTAERIERSDLHPVGQTETVEPTADPSFGKKLRVVHEPQKAWLHFDVFYDKFEHESPALSSAEPCFVGSAKCKTAELLSYPTGMQIGVNIVANAASGTIFPSYLHVCSKRLLDVRTKLLLQFSAQRIYDGGMDDEDGSDGDGGSDAGGEAVSREGRDASGAPPEADVANEASAELGASPASPVRGTFLRLGRSSQSGVWADSRAVCRTEFLMDEKGPGWRELQVSAQKLCRGDLSSIVFCTWCYWDKDGAHEPIGTARVALVDLLLAPRGDDTFQMHDPETGRLIGRLRVSAAQICGFGMALLPTFAELYRPIAYRVNRVTKAAEMPRTLRLTDTNSTISLDKKGKIDQAFVYDSATKMKETPEDAEDAAQEFTVGNSDFEVIDRLSSNVLSQIQRRARYQPDGRASTCFEQLRMRAPAGTASDKMLALPRGLHQVGNPIVAMGHRRGWNGDPAVHAMAVAVTACNTPHSYPSSIRRTTKAWGLWPDPSGKKLTPFGVTKLLMPPLPDNTSSKLLAQERRKQSLIVVRSLVFELADNAIGLALGYTHAATMIANAVILAAANECREEIAREAVYAIVHKATTWLDACHLACSGAIRRGPYCNSATSRYFCAENRDA